MENSELKTYEEIIEETGYIVWKNVGVSMRPLIRQGKDIFVISKITKPLQNYDVVLFKRPGVDGRGHYVLHRILKINPDGTYFIVGDNCIGGETVARDNIIGILTKLKRSGRNINFNGLIYKLYVYLWCRPYKVRIFIQRLYRLGRRILAYIYRRLFKK